MEKRRKLEAGNALTPTTQPCWTTGLRSTRHQSRPGHANGASRRQPVGPIPPIPDFIGRRYRSGLLKAFDGQTLSDHLRQLRPVHGDGEATSIRHVIGGKLRRTSSQWPLPGYLPPALSHPHPPRMTPAGVGAKRAQRGVPSWRLPVGPVAIGGPSPVLMLGAGVQPLYGRGAVAVAPGASLGHSDGARCCIRARLAGSQLTHGLACQVIGHPGAQGPSGSSLAEARSAVRPIWQLDPTMHVRYSCLCTANGRFEFLPVSSTTDSMESPRCGPAPGSATTMGVPDVGGQRWVHPMGVASPACCQLRASPFQGLTGR